MEEFFCFETLNHYLSDSSFVYCNFIFIHLWTVRELKPSYIVKSLIIMTSFFFLLGKDKEKNDKQAGQKMRVAGADDR